MVNAAAHTLRAVAERPPERVDPAGMHNIVGIAHQNERGSRAPHADVSGGVGAHPTRSIHYPHPGILTTELAHYRGRAVGRTVISDNHLKRTRRLLRHQAAQLGTKSVCLISAGNDDADLNSVPSIGLLAVELSVQTIANPLVARFANLRGLAALLSSPNLSTTVVSKWELRTDWIS